jgi:hypothetical protein
MRRYIFGNRTADLFCSVRLAASPCESAGAEKIVTTAILYKGKIGIDEVVYFILQVYYKRLKFFAPVAQLDRATDF